ncbi:molybdenum cofactor biosynthesis protein MoaE [Pseudosulfitobacter sp. DSM 107133]|uniref:molybdenum cofactor biosynthesis protein MoaE n=1 Tax=Pseudosulfitobacter sp. DSM 107133 TaxID=2883100 RepID=UPI000DF3D206|nr:molybdenum cofactor biosynthesis protein MoaE [Pseudosulfitobacter sp. DSM 107133]UOA28171.1 Molybdopterin synthase catalytic subunit [Pseudosulfitobacter sp. DSM 107133]
MRITVQEDAFDAGAELNGFAAGHRDMGAIVTFSGVVRDLPDDPLVAMEIEHYPGMTETALSDIALRAQERWQLGDVLVIHRFGRLAPGEVIMMVATAAPHRRDAFEAAEYLMDFLKSRAPFWKREITANGASEWVAAKDADEDALNRW